MEKLKSLLKVTALVSELKFKHHSLDYSSRFITLITSHREVGSTPSPHNTPGRTATCRITMYDPP